MTKCKTSPTFRKKLLSEILTSIGVDNEIVDDGILVDTAKLKTVKKRDMPMMVFMNYDWMMRCEKGLDWAPHRWPLSYTPAAAELRRRTSKGFLKNVLTFHKIYCIISL